MLTPTANIAQHFVFITTKIFFHILMSLSDSLLHLSSQYYLRTCR